MSSSVAPGDFQENPIYAYFPGPPFRPKQHTVTHTYIHTHTQNNNENIEGSFGLPSITHGNFTLKCHHFQGLRAATVVDIQLDGCPDPSIPALRLPCSFWICSSTGSQMERMDYWPRPLLFKFSQQMFEIYTLAINIKFDYFLINANRR